MLKASWNAALIEELAAFPNGQHDDQVDALSLAFNQMLGKIGDMERCERWRAELGSLRCGGSPFVGHSRGRAAGELHD
jgi:hypothetical protein